MKKLAILSILLLLIFSACRKNIDETNIIETTPDPPTLEDYEPLVENVNASVKGFVTDENNEPATGVTVSLNGQNTTTDAYGHFFFKNMTMNTRGTFVKVEKSGYFEGSRRFFPLKDSESYIKIALLPKKFDYSFTAQNGGTITTAEGTSIIFKANSIKTANGTLYTGEVQLATQWLDPTAESTFEQMPGDLQGVNTSNEEVALISYGMMAVELRGTNGEKLNIANGSKATLSMPVPASLLTDAPTTIPLWSFNETYGVWAEEGKAILQNGKYVGDVSHFSFWNCDYPLPYVQLEFQLVDENQNPLPNYIVIIKRSNGAVGYGYTDENGKDSGLVPANESFTLEVINPFCDAVIYTQNIGPFSTDTDLNIIQVAGTNVNTQTITGQLVNCNAEPIENGVAIIKYGGQTRYQYIDNGNFEAVLTACESVTEIEIIGVDLDNSVQSETINTTVIANGQIGLGQINVCDVQLENYIKLNVNGLEVIYLGATVQQLMGNDSTNVSAGSQQFYASITFANQGVGSQSNLDLIYFYDINNNWGIVNGLDNLTIIEYGAVGERIRGTFSGTMLNYGYSNPINPPVEVQITGEFSVIRQ